MSELTLGPIGQIGVTVKDAARAVPFYRDTLGLRLLFEFPNLAFFDCAGVRLMLNSVPEPESFRAAIYFRVDDIGKAHQALVGRGATFEKEPHMIARMPDHELWMAFLRDPDGNLLALMSEVRP